MSSQLIWELVKKNNAFITKGLNGTTFSKEAGNLYNLSSYKYSGLANRKSTVSVDSVGSDVVLSKSSKKSKVGKLHQVVIKKNARRTNVAVGKEAASIRPDLKSAAQARASAVTKSLRKRKATQSS